MTFGSPFLPIWTRPVPRSEGTGFFSAHAGIRTCRAVNLSQCDHMIVYAAAEHVEVVAAFEHAEDAALRVAVGQFNDLLGHPAETTVRQVEAAERVVGVGVEAGGDQDRLGLELRHGGRNALLERGLNHFVGRAG